MSKIERYLIGLLLVAYGPALYVMARTSLSVDYGSHGPVVPLVSIWLVLRVPRRYWPVRGERDVRGLMVITGAVLVYLLGLGSGILFMQGLAFVASVAGLILYTRGAGALRALSFPVVFLLFMIPLPVDWVRPVIFYLQLGVSEASVTLLQSVGYVLLREGNVLVLPGETRLGVAEACSGITSLLTLIPLGVLIAMLVGKSWRERLPLLLAVVPVALLGNLTRVVVTVMIAEAHGANFATKGSLHENLGLVTYVVAVGLLLGLARLLAGLAGRRAARAG